MKVRFTRQGVRVRIDDLELAALQRGEILKLETLWLEGGWTLELSPLSDGLEGMNGHLKVGIRELLPMLGEPEREGVRLEGPPRVDVEKDFGAVHA
ncbi:hypothetical protein [Deinococcus arenicola]|uniref:Uncharacterized protein n=1 Tax=Deinococcus arenicola TaxID=2994950 RepID=A0ABU4DNF4_9DEIO|nr:hypothetical protein [Deinococcus sp. ZS9-10]MDV6373219.1 hypothetical protein [Deinococcus sp. ZS9-10]